MITPEVYPARQHQSSHHLTMTPKYPPSQYSPAPGGYTDDMPVPVKDLAYHQTMPTHFVSKK